MNKNKLKFGFTLLYASMIAGLLLAVGAAILSITVKQVSLSAAGRESQFAFYNADTGTECARYLYRASKQDLNCPDGLFPSATSTVYSLCSASNYKCLGSSLDVIDPNSGSSISNFDTTSGLYEFKISSTTPNICFDVIVDKKTDINKTSIISKGYNTCNGVNVFERAIQVDF